jgi:hypothetical protein
MKQLDWNDSSITLKVAVGAEYLPSVAESHRTHQEVRMRTSNPSATTSVTGLRCPFVVVYIQFNVSEASQMIAYPQKLGLIAHPRKHFLPRRSQEFHPLLPHEII